MFLWRIVFDDKMGGFFLWQINHSFEIWQNSDGFRWNPDTTFSDFLKINHWKSDIGIIGEDAFPVSAWIILGKKKVKIKIIMCFCIMIYRWFFGFADFSVGHNKDCRVSNNNCDLYVYIQISWFLANAQNIFILLRKLFAPEKAFSKDFREPWFL